MSEETRVTLRSTAEEYRIIADTLEGLDPEDPLYEEALAEFSASITRGQEKVDRFAGFLRRLSAEQGYLAKEADRLRHRIVMMENLERRLREYAVRALQDAALHKISGRDSTLSLRKKPDAVDVYDEALVPASFKRVLTTITVDKRLVRGAIETGEDVPGARIRTGEDGLAVS